MVQKNDVIQLEITDLTHEGQGVGRYEGMAVFVPQTAPGDVAQVKVVKVHPSYCYGILLQLVRSGPGRQQPDCPAYRQCGGCTLRHITYEQELACKDEWVHQALRRVGGVMPRRLPILPSPLVQGYRNKAIYPVAMQNGRVAIGFYAPRSHRVVDFTGCALHPPHFGQVLECLRGLIDQEKIPVYDEASHTGLLRAIYLRHAEYSGQTMVCLVVNGRALPGAGRVVKQLCGQFPQVASIQLNVNCQRTNVMLGKENLLLWGSGTIWDELCGVRLQLSPLSFYQVNRQAAQLLYRAAREMAGLGGKDVLLDLYCGAGAIGLSMADAVGQLIGVELVPDAVENARANARSAGVENARFLCGDAAQAAAQLAGEGIRPTVVVVDPPRKGLTPALMDTVAGMGPGRVVYISCNFATAARDCAYFSQLGYQAVAAQAVDLFPRTSHVECVLLLEKGAGAHPAGGGHA